MNQGHRDTPNNPNRESSGGTFNNRTAKKNDGYDTLDKDSVGKAATRTVDKMERTASKAGSMAEDLGEKAKKMTSDFSAKAAEYAEDAGGKAAGTIASFGRTMNKLAGSIRQNVPADTQGRVGGAAAVIADGLECSARYLEEKGLSNIGSDLGDVMKRYPVQSFFGMVGLGVLIGKSLRRS